MNSRLALFVRAAGGVAVPIIPLCARKPRQPRLATDAPALIGWFELIRSIQGAEMHFDFIVRARKYGRAAMGTEMAPLIGVRLAFDYNRARRKDRSRIEHRAMVFATLQAMAHTDPVRRSRRRQSNTTAQAATGHAIHSAPPFEPTGVFAPTVPQLPNPLPSARGRYEVMVAGRDLKLSGSSARSARLSSRTGPGTRRFIPRLRLGSAPPHGHRPCVRHAGGPRKIRVRLLTPRCHRHQADDVSFAVKAVPTDQCTAVARRLCGVSPVQI